MTKVSDAVFCLCGKEAYIVLADDVLCPFCFLTEMVTSGNLEPERADHLAVVLRARRAEENHRIHGVVFGSKS